MSPPTTPPPILHTSRWRHVVLDCDVVLSYLCPDQTPSFVCNAMGGGGSASLGPTASAGSSPGSYGGGKDVGRFGSAANQEKARQLEYKTRVMRASAYARIGRFASVIDDCNVVSTRTTRVCGHVRAACAGQDTSGSLSSLTLSTSHLTIRSWTR